MKNVLLICLVFLTNLSFGQDLSVVWSGAMTGNISSFPSYVAMTIDSEGNTYYTGNSDYTNGEHYGLVDEDGYISTNSGSQDVFIVKVAPNGNFLWGKAFDSPDDNEASDIAIDDSGYVYILGRFEGTVDFDPGIGVDSYTCQTLNNQFIVKLDSLGNYVWTSVFEGVNFSIVNKLTVDYESNVLILGIIGDTIDFDPSPAVYELSPPIEDPLEYFITKLDHDGDLLWAKVISGAGNSRKNITTDTLNNIYITGAFNDTADFDPGPGIVEVVANGENDYFTLKLDKDGDYLWSYTAGATGNDFGEVITVDKNFNVYVSGHFEGTVNFGTVSDPNLVTAFWAQFIQKIDPNGIPLWTKSMLVSSIVGINIGDDGSCYFGGYFGQPVDFNPGVGEEIISHVGGYDVFMLKLDSSGEFEWVEVAQGPYGQTCVGFEMDEYENLYISGDFNGTIDVSLGEGTVIHGAGNAHLRPYVAKYHQCSHSTSTEVVQACDSYVWPLTGNTYSSSNQYAVNQTDIYGCDSTLFLDLTIINNNYTVSNTGYVLTANQTGASYQWISCDDSLIIPDEINQTFTPTSNGDYAVIVTNNGCTDTSICYSIVGLGLEKNNFSNKLSIYPNPTNGDFTIDLGEDVDHVNVTIMDVLGKIVQSNSFTDSQILELKMDAPSGMYTVVLESGNGKRFIKLLKE